MAAISNSSKDSCLFDVAAVVTAVDHSKTTNLRLS